MNAFRINRIVKDELAPESLNANNNRYIFISLREISASIQATPFAKVLFCVCLILYASNSFSQIKEEQKKRPENASEGLKRKNEASNSGTGVATPKQSASKESSINSKTAENQHPPQFDFNQLPPELQQKVNSNKANGQPLLEGIVKAYRVELKNCKNESECKKTLAFLNEERDFVSMDYREGSYVDLRVGASMKSEELKSLLLSRGLDFNFINEYYLLEATN